MSCLSLDNSALSRRFSLASAEFRFGRTMRCHVGAERAAKLVDVAALIVQGRARKLQRLALRRSGPAKIHIGFFQLGDGVARDLKAPLELRQPPADGLLQHAVGVLLFQQPPLAASSSALISAILTGAYWPRPARGSPCPWPSPAPPRRGEARWQTRREAGPCRPGCRRSTSASSLRAARGEPHGAIPQRWHEQQGKQARDQEARAPHTCQCRSSTIASQFPPLGASQEPAARAE